MVASPKNPFQPKYERAKDVLRGWIKSMTPGSKLPPVHALREQLELSHGTVMRALKELVEEGVIERRHNRGAFVAARDTATRNVLVVWPELVEEVTGKPFSTHPYTSRILYSIQRAAAQRNQNLLITRKLVAGHPDFDVGTNHVCGAILFFNYDRAFVEGFISRGVPIVLVEPLLRVQGVPFVATDHCTDVREATMDLIRKGHSKILYIAIDSHLRIPDLQNHEEITNFVVEERVRGYQIAMREAGLEEVAHVHYCRSNPWEELDKDSLLETLLSRNVTACCCFNDDIAARTYFVCHKHGISIPADLSVIGHDDADIAWIVQPPLTTIQSPLDDIGTQAMVLLGECLDGRRTDGDGILIPSKKVERESVASLSAGPNSEV